MGDQQQNLTRMKEKNTPTMQGVHLLPPGPPPHPLSQDGLPLPIHQSCTTSRPRGTSATCRERTGPLPMESTQQRSPPTAIQHRLPEAGHPVELNKKAKRVITIGDRRRATRRRNAGYIRGSSRDGGDGGSRVHRVVLGRGPRLTRGFRHCHGQQPAGRRRRQFAHQRSGGALSLHDKSRTQARPLHILDSSQRGLS